MAGRDTTRPGSGGNEDDFALTERDIDLLLDELTRAFSDEDRAIAFLRAVRFPQRLTPGWRSDAFEFWTRIFEDLGRGAMETPYRRLIAGALRVYGSNRVLEDLQQRYEQEATEEEPADAQSPSAEQAPEPEPEPACHVVVRIGSEDERADIEAWLADQDLDPRQEWSTLTAVSFRLNEADPNTVRATMVGRPDLGWTVVPPGQPDYLLRYLFVEGPDGRSFRFNDVPASSTIGSVATEMIDHYPEGLPGSDRPTVVDHVGPDGAGRRANPDSTLHDEGVEDGDRLRVGFERTAAAVNPLDRRDALFGVRNQMQEYVDKNPGFKVWPNSPALPTEYEIEFTRASVGPPLTPGGQPPDVSVHELSIVLGPEFPITAPRVRWLSDIFHPNVFPTYDCQTLRERDYMRGLVCLGTLTESYEPAMNFGELCATLADIAGYRNYSVAILDNVVVDPLTGGPMLRGDWYDKDAAYWAASIEGQERIRKLGGTPLLQRLVSVKPARYGYEIEPDE